MTLENGQRRYPEESNATTLGRFAGIFSVAASVPYSILLYFLIQSALGGGEGDGVLSLFTMSLPVTAGLALVGFGLGLTSVVMKRGKTVTGWIGVILNAAFALLLAFFAAMGRSLL